MYLFEHVNKSLMQTQIFPTLFDSPTKRENEMENKKKIKKSKSNETVFNVSNFSFFFLYLFEPQAESNELYFIFGSIHRKINKIACRFVRGAKLIA